MTKSSDHLPPFCGKQIICLQPIRVSSFTYIRYNVCNLVYVMTITDILISWCQTAISVSYFVRIVSKHFTTFPENKNVGWLLGITSIDWSLFNAKWIVFQIYWWRGQSSQIINRIPVCKNLTLEWTNASQICKRFVLLWLDGFFLYFEKQEVYSVYNSVLLPNFEPSFKVWFKMCCWTDASSNKRISVIKKI